MDKNEKWLYDLEEKITLGTRVYSYDGQGFNFGFKKVKGQWWLLLGSIFNILAAEAKTEWAHKDKLQICFAPISDDALIAFLEFSDEYSKKFGSYPKLDYKKIMKEERLEWISTVLKQRKKTKEIPRRIE